MWVCCPVFWPGLSGTLTPRDLGRHYHLSQAVAGLLQWYWYQMKLDDLRHPLVPTASCQLVGKGLNNTPKLESILTRKKPASQLMISEWKSFHVYMHIPCHFFCMQHILIFFTYSKNGVFLHTGLSKQSYNCVNFVWMENWDSSGFTEPNCIHVWWC